MGEGKGKVLIRPPRKCAAPGPGLDRPRRHLGDAPSKMLAPSIPPELGGVPLAPTFAMAPQPPRTSGSALLSEKGISFFEIRQPGPKELFSSIVQA